MPPLLFLERLSVLPFPPPIPEPLHPVAERLASLGYTNVAILGACLDIEATGTARGSENIDAEDVEQVEKLIRR